MKYFALIIAFLGLQFATSQSLDEDQWLWEAYKARFNKTYTKDEEGEYRKIFFLNVNWIREINSKNNGYRFGWNEYADQNRRKFNSERNKADVSQANITNAEKPQYLDKRKRRDVTQAVPPQAFDWRVKPGVLQPIKHQGSCGSCWAFAATTIIESRSVINSKTKSIGLSEQNLADCVYPRNGCDGGWPTSAFEWVKTNAGQNTESDYPYTSGKPKCTPTTKSDCNTVGGITRCTITTTNTCALAATGTCNYDSTKPHTAITGFAQSANVDEYKLKQLVTAGPVAAVIDASDIQFYRTGIFNCKGTPVLNHAVVIVGYGTEKNEDYWIVRNSWGPQWGIDGYIYVTRKPDGNCGLDDYVMYATV